MFVNVINGTVSTFFADNKKETGINRSLYVLTFMLRLKDGFEALLHK